MRNKALALLANQVLTARKQYNELSILFTEIAHPQQVYFYNLGFTEQKLECLKYEIKNHLGISEKDVALYTPTEEVAETTTKKEPKVEIANVNDGNGTENPVWVLMEDDAKDGFKLRDEYPFLDSEHCPDELKVLVSDKIAAYRRYAQKHAEALAISEDEANDELYNKLNEVVKEWEFNQSIKEELDFFRDSNGKVLGKHPKLKNLRIKQEIYEMSEAELVKHKGNAQKSINKYKDKEDKTELLADWQYRLQLVEERLNREFKTI